MKHEVTFEGPFVIAVHYHAIQINDGPIRVHNILYGVEGNITCEKCDDKLTAFEMARTSAN